MANDISSSTWSETDASNNASPPNGWPEGQAPSSVNDCARAMMGAIKRTWDRDHASANTTVGGTANAITLTLAVAPAAYVQGEKYAFVSTAANTGATTINVSSLGAKSIFAKTAAGVAACAGGEIQSGDIVEIEYDGTQFQITGALAPASNTVTAAGTDTRKAVTAAALASIFSNSLGVSGWQKLPGGLIIQWDAVASVPAGANTVQAYPIAFPNAALVIVGCTGTPVATGAPQCLCFALSTVGGFAVANADGGAPHTGFYIALGH